MFVQESTTTDEPVVAAVPEDDWDNIPTASGKDFFEGDKDEEAADTPAPATPPADKAPVDAPAASTETPAPAAPSTNEDDDFWSDEAPAAGTVPAASKSLRSLIAEKYGVTVNETDNDEAVLASLEARLQSVNNQPNDPLTEVQSRLALDKRALVKQRLMDEFKAGESAYDSEDDIEDELDKWTESGVLEKKFNSERRRLEAQKQTIETERAETATRNKANMDEMRNDFSNALEKFEFGGAKFPARQMPVIKDFIESGKYIRQMTQGVWEDGTPMTAGEMVEQAVFANKTFRAKFIQKSNETYAAKVLSDYIKGLENRAQPTETGGFTAPASGEITVGHKEFFGGK